MRKPAQPNAVSTFITCESNMQWLKQQKDLLIVAVGVLVYVVAKRPKIPVVSGLERRFLY